MEKLDNNIISTNNSNIVENNIIDNSNNFKDNDNDNENKNLNTINLQEIYDDIKKNNEIHKRIGLDEIEEMISKDEKIPDIREFQDTPLENNTEILTKLYENVSKPKKPWNN